MGDASITITYDRYGHLMPGARREAAALMDAYLDRAETQRRLRRPRTLTLADSLAVTARSAC
jgi:hypothetical protein